MQRMNKKGIQVRFVLVLSLVGILFPMISSQAEQEKKVLWVELSEPITPASAEKVSAAVEELPTDKYNAILITLDTFGGSADSTFKIMDAIQSSTVPVIGYVYPAGKHAFSAGTIILMTSDLAAMAPYSTIGSSQPVIGSQPTNESKFVNAIIGKLTAQAELHGRNSTQVGRFVTHNDNLTPEQALKNHVIEVIAASPEDLLAKANGTKVSTLKGEVVLNTINAQIIDRKSTRLNSSHSQISYAVFCLKKKKKYIQYICRRTERTERTYTHGRMTEPCQTMRTTIILRRPRGRMGSEFTKVSHSPEQRRH